MKKEIWKCIKDYEGLYMVSNCGRVKSFDRWVKGRNGSVRLIKGRILKPVTNTFGYLQVGLFKNGKVKAFTVHRLVAEAFLPNPHNYPCVNHKDENKQNNNVSNLEWCTAQYNNTYGTRIERVAEKTTNGKCSKPVLQYTLDGQFVREWESTAECGRNGYHQGHVADCCQGKQKTHKGYIWKYK